MSEDIHDIAILGGGPVGLFGAFYAGMRHMNTLIVDSLSELGGQLMALYPEKFVYDVGGFPKVLAKDLAEGLVEQATQFHPTVALEETLVGLERLEEADAWRLTGNRGAHVARTVMISAGIGAFEPRRLKVDGVERFDGHGVQYLVRDKMALAGKRILIVGGGDSACDWAVNLQGIAGSLTLIHRRDEFRAHESTVKEIHESEHIDLLTHYEVRAVHGEERVERATIFDNRTDEERTLDLDVVLVNIGFKADLGPIKEWGIEMTRRKIVVNDRMETNLPGIYAAGDVTEHEGKLDLIATGFGEAAVAVNFAKARIDPGARAFPGHSTEGKWREE